MSLVIDIHSHYMPPEVAEHTSFFKAGWSNLQGQLKLMDQAGIEKSLLLYPTSDAHLKMGGWSKLCEAYNRCLAEIVKKYPQRFLAAGILPVDSPQHFPSELKRIEDFGFPAISLASSYDGLFLDDPKFYPIFEFAQSKKMPIHVHAQIMNPIGEERVRDPLLTPVLEYVLDVSMSLGKLMMNGVFEKYPGVKFIFAHYGGVLPLVKERFDTTYIMLRKREIVKDLKKLPSEYFKNIYVDTSGSKSVASLLCALEVTDASHILFGSDFPANQNFVDSMASIEKAGLSGDQKQSILYNNAKNIFSRH